MSRRLLSAAAVAGLATTCALAVPAHAAKSWTFLGDLDGAKLQACKDSVDSDTWRFYLRVNATNGGTRVKGTVTFKKPGPDKVWTSGWVRPGDVVVGSRTAPKGAGWKIEYVLGADGMGGGGSATFADIGRC